MDSLLVTKHTGDNVTPLRQQEKIKEQAGAWIVLIDQRPLSYDEKAELNQWLARSTYHRDYFAKLAKNWDAMAMLEELAVLFPLPEVEPDKVTTKQRGRLRRWFQLEGNWSLPAFAVSTVFASVLTLVVFLAIAPEQKTLMTAVGENKRFELSDGSILTLNTGSQVEVDYQRGVRQVSLVRGEAHFDVTKNPDRPFVVYAGEGLVWAVGTAFNVRVNHTGVNVLVTEGRVKVYTDVNDQHVLPSLVPAVTQVADNTLVSEALVDAGQSLQYSQHIGAIEPLAEDQIEKETAWQHGALVFKGETLEQAVSEIARYTEKRLVIVDPVIKSRRVGGHYQTNDVDALLAALAQGFSIEVKYVGGDRVHLSAKQP